MDKSRFGSSPLGSPTQRKVPTRARGDLLKTFFEFLEVEPTANESEMLDMIISCFLWSYEGYEKMFEAAEAAFRIVHKEEPTWKKKTLK